MHFLCLDVISSFDVIVVTPPTPEEDPSCISQKSPNYSSLINVLKAIFKTRPVSMVMHSRREQLHSGTTSSPGA